MPTPPARRPASGATEVGAAPRVVGFVRWFDPTRGYGFLTSAEGGDAFVHVSGFAAEMTDEPPKGMGVTYEVEPGRRRMQAVPVRPE
jgi:CspA family cold shock protein